MRALAPQGYVADPNANWLTKPVATGCGEMPMLRGAIAAGNSGGLKPLSHPDDLWIPRSGILRIKTERPRKAGP
jgi:hypothetical protein